MWWWIVAACTSEDGVELDEPTTEVAEDVLLNARDVGPSSGYEDIFFGHYNRGRAAIVMDYDLDGRLDELSGNPGDVTYLLHNISTGPGDFKFEPTQVIAEDVSFQSYWGGAAADYDNDGDQDVFIAYGGNDTIGADRILRNDLLPDRSNAAAPFVQIADEAGIGFVTPSGVLTATRTMGALWFDFDQDSFLDLYAVTEMRPIEFGEVTFEEGTGLDQLYRNLGDGTFEDVGLDAGLVTQRSGRNPSGLDYDLDGDIDLLELGFLGGSVFWRNRFSETGRILFEDATAEVSLGGGDLSFPELSSAFCSITADLNNDGWEDLVVFRRGLKDEPKEPEVHDLGHLIWLNVEGTGFVEVAVHTDLNDTFYWRDHNNGVMSCQVGDYNADGFPDLTMGNGAPDLGGALQLYVSTERTEVDIAGVGTVRIPQFRDVSYLLDIISPGDTDYPYRHHGHAAADYDGDGFLELGAHNGGPMLLQTDLEMQEPNQLYVFDRVDGLHYLKVALRGDGVAINRDAVGARVHVRVARPDEPDLYRVRVTGSGFASQNDPNLYFGLLYSDEIEYVEVTWPDGTTKRIDAPAVDQTLTITY